MHPINMDNTLQTAIGDGSIATATAPFIQVTYPRKDDPPINASSPQDKITITGDYNPRPNKPFFIYVEVDGLPQYDSRSDRPSGSRPLKMDLNAKKWSCEVQVSELL